MRAWGWPARVDFPGESRRFGGASDCNEYFLEVHEPRHYPNGPALPLKGPIPDDHPVGVANRAVRQAIRVHRDRFIEARRFLHGEVAAGRVDAVRHWLYGEYCEMSLANFLEVLRILGIDLERLPGTPDAAAVSADISDFIARLNSGEQDAIRVTLGMTTSEWNPYQSEVFFDEEALKLFTGPRYVPEIPYKLNGMRI